MEEMNQAEVAREETEQKMIYKFLLMIKESESLEDLEEKTKTGRYLPPSGTRYRITCIWL